MSTYVEVADRSAEFPQRRALSWLLTDASVLFATVVVALALRLIVMGFFYPAQLDPDRDHWRFGYETGRIARSIVEGHGFSSPLFGPTGPSAMLPPVYPAIVAGFFFVFGVYTKAAAVAILSFQAIISALTCIPVYFIAQRSFGQRAARWAAWGWALFPYGIYFPVTRIWGTWLATLLLSILFLMTLQLRRTSTRGAWLGYGALWAVTALTEPMVLAVLPALGACLLYRQYQRVRLSFTRPALAGLAFVVVVTPWFVRNYRVFHQFVPFRDGFGLSLILGTKAPTVHWATYGVGVGPWHSEYEWSEFQRLGEFNYMKRLQRLAVESIRTDPGWFAIRTIRRVVFLWTGFWSFDRTYLAEEPLDLPNIPFCTAVTVLALFGVYRGFRTDGRLAVLYASVLVFFPLIYYTTSPEDYYRRPLDPILVILAASYLSSRSARADACEPAEDELLVPAET